jgi:hypothetical protein
VDSSSIELAGSTIQSLEIKGNQILISFSPARVIKTMTGSVERTQWTQQGELIFEQASLVAPQPTLPAICEGGDVGENVYTYRDMIPMPLVSQGRAHCKLKLQSGETLEVEGSAVRLVMQEPAKYVAHIR